MTLNDEYHDNLAPGIAHWDSGGCDPDRTGNRIGLFDRALWFDGLHRHCLAKQAPHIAYSAEDGDAAKLYLIDAGRAGMLAMANWYSFIWRPVFGGNPDSARRRMLLDRIARELPRRTHRLVLAPVPDEDGSASLIADTFSAAGWLVSREQSDENHVLHVGGRSFDAYWATRPGQLRSTVKRKGAKGVVDLRIETNFNAASWLDYETIYARSWKPEEGNPDFLRWLAAREAEAGRLRMGIASIDGVAVAAQFWTVENGTAYIHKLAHDERHLHASPGTLLTHALFAHVIDTDHVDLVDFGTGSDAYKRDWMEDVRPRYRLEMLWPRAPLAWPYMARRRMAGLAARMAKD
ncbi:GNAT family N-acetyltransferase [Blastomonas sp.]|uniref:GNAT family N-acetyltransferase n=1 Tax=Blastomonas sp. TaxID=1909299 RepID=UPI00260C3559|nr:GNAT family N-acetyltransferase [Blastomonas sp.]MDM7954994.1 GNAT family N-acetyltransferase [Blastomonas sp.]